MANPFIEVNVTQGPSQHVVVAHIQSISRRYNARDQEEYATVHLVGGGCLHLSALYDSFITRLRTYYPYE